MKHNKYARLLRELPDLTDILRGSLLPRIIRHRQGCSKCERGEGHPVSVLAVSYPGGQIRQISLRREQVPAVRRQLENYQRVKASRKRFASSTNRPYARRSPIPSPGGASVIELRRQQRRFGDGCIRETVEELWEGWMLPANAVLADEKLLYGGT